MVCKNCGAEVKEGAKFCENCGAELIEKVEADIVEPGPTGSTGSTGSADTTGSTGSAQTNYTYQQPQSMAPAIDAHATSVICYFTWIGWLIAFLLGDRENAKFHLNQALVIKLFGLLSAVPVVGWMWGIFIFVMWIMGLIYAIEQTETEVPLIGAVHIL